MTTPADPYLTHTFSVSVSNASGIRFEGYFTEVSGMSFEVSTIEYKTFNSTSGQPEVQVIPGRPNAGTLTLKHGVTDDQMLWNWCKMVTSGKLMDARSTVTVTAYDRLYVPKLTWTLFNAWPSKFNLDSFSASESNFVLEELTLVYERIEFTKVATT